MEGVFHSASSTTEFHFAQESKRTSYEFNAQNFPASIRSGVPSNKCSIQQLGEPNTRPQSSISTPYSRYSFENNQPNINLNPPHRYSFLSGLEKLKTLTYRDNENSDRCFTQVPNEAKNAMNTVGDYEEFRPSLSTRRSLTNRSKTPTGYCSKGNSTFRGESSQTPLRHVFSRETEINGQENMNEESCTTTRNHNRSSEKVFQVSTGKIVDRSAENRLSLSLMRGSCSNRTSVMKWSKSKMGDSPQKSVYATPNKRHSRMDSLKKIKLAESPNASNGAKLGLNLVKETLEEATEEKEKWRVRVEELKAAIQQEKVCLEKSQENIRFTFSHLGRLTKKNQNLDKSTMNTQSQVNRAQEEADLLQSEIYSYMDKIKHINEQIEAEAKLVKYNRQLMVALKAQISEQMKGREVLKGEAKNSRHVRSRSSDRYQNTVLVLVLVSAMHTIIQYAS